MPQPNPSVSDPEVALDKKRDYDLPDDAKKLGVTKGDDSPALEFLDEQIGADDKLAIEKELAQVLGQKTPPETIPPEVKPPTPEADQKPQESPYDLSFLEDQEIAKPPEQKLEGQFDLNKLPPEQMEALEAEILKRRGFPETNLDDVRKGFKDKQNLSNFMLNDPDIATLAMQKLAQRQGMPVKARRPDQPPPEETLSEPAHWEGMKPEDKQRLEDTYRYMMSKLGVVTRPELDKNVENLSLENKVDRASEYLNSFFGQKEPVITSSGFKKNQVYEKVKDLAYNFGMPYIDPDSLPRLYNLAMFEMTGGLGTDAQIVNKNAMVRTERKRAASLPITPGGGAPGPGGGESGKPNVLDPKVFKTLKTDDMVQVLSQLFKLQQ